MRSARRLQRSLRMLKQVDDLVAALDAVRAEEDRLGASRITSCGYFLQSSVCQNAMDASVHQMPFYSRMYLNLLIGRIHWHVTSDRLHEQQISRRRPPEMNIRKHLCWIVLIVFRKVRQFPHVNCLIDLISVNLPTTGSAMHFSHFVFVISFWP